MNLGDVMDAIADRLGLIDGLRVHKQPPDALAPPAAWVGYPEAYIFDATYGRGMDRISSLPVVIVTGRASDRSARNQISAYCEGAGPKSVKAMLESGVYTAFDSVRVVGVEFDFLTHGGSDLVAAIFELDIAGQGS